MRITVCSFFAGMIFSAGLYAQTAPAAKPAGKRYNDGHGGTVLLPLGDISFADEVVSFTPGDPPAIDIASNSSLSIGIPNFDGIQGGFCTLGCGGTLILQFKDNALVNIKGPDLFVFEMGKYIEPTNLSVSKDGINWIHVGKIDGAKAAVDIGDSVKPGDIFYFVKLTDMRTECSGSWPGADIDAVAAIGSAKRISLNSAVLFALNESVLKPEAKAALDKVAAEINTNGNYDIVIEGHTDSTGTRARNQPLSQQRANSVKKYLYSQLTNKQTKMISSGYADKFPAASNSTKEGQEKNRRVEIILVPRE